VRHLPAEPGRPFHEKRYPDNAMEMKFARDAAAAFASMALPAGEQ
jgi:hypothetical protein